MRPINTALLRLAKRAETYDRQHLIDSFVDIGPLFTLLSNPDNQILFGRRGTGKTHVLGYLANEVQKRGSITVQLDMRTIGSTGGIYSDTRLTISERATRLLVDTLCAIHDQILTEVLEKAEEYDLSKLGPLLDRFVEAATDLVVQGTVEVEEMTSSTTADASTTKMGLGVSRDQVGSSLSVSNERASQREEASRRKREGAERLRVHFGAVGSAIDGVVSALPNSALWVILDEWSEIPLDLQPDLADLLRRTVLPIRGGNTTRAPRGLFEADVDGRAGFVEVPYTDFRSIRRAILDLGLFYSRMRRNGNRSGGSFGAAHALTA